MLHAGRVVQCHAESQGAPNVATAEARTVRSTIGRRTDLAVVHPGGPNRASHSTPTIYTLATRMIIIKVIFRICCRIRSTRTITRRYSTYCIVRKRRCPRLRRFIPCIPCRLYARIQDNGRCVVRHPDGYRDPICEANLLTFNKLSLRGNGSPPSRGKWETGLPRFARNDKES